MDGRDMLNSILCDELLAEILCRVSDPVDQESTSLVCKRWKKVQRNAKWRLNLCMPSDVACAATFCTSLPSLLAQHPYITSLSIRSKTHVSANILVARALTVVATCCKLLKHLSFTVGTLSFIGFEELSKGCPGLVSLEVLQPSSATCLRTLSYFKALQELCLWGHMEDAVCTSEDLACTVHDALNAYYHGSLPLLKLCIFNMRSCASCDLRWLWRSCKQLQRLELSNCEGVGDTASMPAFVHCMPSLRELKLNRCRAIARQVMSLASNHSPELRALTVHDGADTEGLRQIVRRCMALEVLDLRLPLDLSREDLTEIGNYGQGLRSLRLHSCWLATGMDLRSLASSITSALEELVLVRCRAITQDPGTLSAIGQSLPKLRHINLSENEFLADNELAAMLAACVGIRHLNLWKCCRLTDMVVEFIGQKCSHLESIDIRECGGITAKAVTCLLTCSRHLRTLCIELCKLSDGSRRLASLKGVHLVTNSCLARDYRGGTIGPPFGYIR